MLTKKYFRVFSILVIFVFCSLVVRLATTFSRKAKLEKIGLDEAGFNIAGKPFRFVGANAVNLVFYDDFNLNIERAIRTAKENGISVIRLFFDWGWGKPEDYDKILSLASDYNLYVILVLTDCCCSSDCVDMNEYFYRHAPYCDLNSQEGRNAFKNRIEQIIMRKNSLNGRIYRDDPTIFAWDIANEPELWHFEFSQINKWLREITRYIKKLDSNHLVTITVGAHNDNFGRESSLYKVLNIPELDFFSFSFYPVPEDWAGGRLGNYKDQLEFSIAKFLSMKKTVIVAEFDFSASGDLNLQARSDQEAAQFYYKVFQEGMDAAFSAGASGVLFWGWDIPEAKKVPMWWSSEVHDATDKMFVDLIKNYQIPDNL